MNGCLLLPLADLLPSEWTRYADRPEWLLWLFMGASFALLVVGGDRAVSAAVKIARVAGLSTVIVGATIVSLGTTAPETIVSVRAALAGAPGLAVGTALGSTICNMALIFGVGCLLTRLPVDRFVLMRHGWLEFGVGALLTIVALLLWWAAGDIRQVYIPRWIGLVMLGLLAAYLGVSVHWSREHPELTPLEAQAKMSRNHLLGRLAGLVVLLGIGLALVVLGAEALVQSATVLSRRHHVPEAVLAGTLVALGTSLPEFVTCIMSIIRGHPELLVGNIIGANILNVLFVIGSATALAPGTVDGRTVPGLHVEPSVFRLLLPCMMLLLLVQRVYFHTTGRRFQRWHALPLLTIYAAYVLASLRHIGPPDR